MAFCARPMLTAWSISRFRANLLAAGFMTGFSNSFGAEILAITPSMAGPAKVATPSGPPRQRRFRSRLTVKACHLAPLGVAFGKIRLRLDATSWRGCSDVAVRTGRQSSPIYTKDGELDVAFGPEPKCRRPQFGSAPVQSGHNWTSGKWRE